MKPMYYKDDDGKEYKISFSEELQMKNLHAARENTNWLKKTFYAKIILILIILALTIAVLFIFFRLDQIDFFTRLAYR
ncbi:MAG TPA: hypothetical protein VJJ23_00815 [Candidatus Nanoarchaeia archaeon]|nr:hypothetical protein [Candidatus Nanoarchaeia archaeon]